MYNCLKSRVKLQPVCLACECFGVEETPFRQSENFEKRAIMTTIVSANDFNSPLIIPLNAASKIMGIHWNFHDSTMFPVGTMARSERVG